MSTSKKWGIGARAAVVAMGATLAASGIGWAAPAPAADTAKGTKPATTVTLVTGDQVALSGSKVKVEPAEGRRHVRFHTTRNGDDVRVIPSDAVPLLRAGKLDRRLFDVTALAAQRRADLRLVVTYQQGKSAARSLTRSGATVNRSLPAINGASVRVAADDADAFWRSISGPSTLAAGVEKIWLDGVKKPLLDQSVPQIGAPAAWQAGFTGSGVKVAVLDTGVDATHPDVASQVVAAKNFTEEDAKDRVGHGTHVASTIAGAAAASGGKYKGVAYDAMLLDGKVCEEFGCYESSIIGGMQWAVEQGAKVVNLSLGGTDTPELDPLEEAVNVLSEQSGTLFVIAAGNEGVFGPETVGSPGSAEAALTVGAVDKQDRLASFSSRGPRVGDSGLKPDLTAPGVDIVAARSKDGVIGTPVGDRYVSLDGTSMATPHTAGAAALLAQQHPSWSGAQLKAALMTSTKPLDGLTVFEQGTGRLDVAKAITQTVLPAPASLSYGVQRWPHDDDQPVVKTLTYRNTGSAPVTLSLTGGLAGPDGKPAPAGALALSASQLAVPANGTASVTVTVNTKHAGPDGLYSGRITATAGNTTIGTALSVNKEVESYDVTITNLDGSGGPADFINVLAGADGIKDALGVGTARLRLPKGAYVAQASIFEDSRLSYLIRPKLVVDREVALTFDARQAKEVAVSVEKATAKPFWADITATARLAGGETFGSGIISFDLEGLFTAHVGEAVPANELESMITAQFAEPGPNEDFFDSPYRYLLTWYQQGRMYTGLNENVRDRQLAKVPSSMSEQQPGRKGSMGVFALGKIPTTTFFTTIDFDLPAKATELYLPGARYRSYATEWDTDSAGETVDYSEWTAPARSYRAGARRPERWGAAVFGPAFPRDDYLHASRAGDLVWVAVPLYSDQDGHPGFARTDSASTTLHRDGKLVWESEDAGLVDTEVEPGKADFVLNVHADRSKVSPFSTIQDATWKFRSGTEDAETPLPLWSVQFKPKVDERNDSKREPILVVPVSAQAQHGAKVGTLRKVRVEVSYDDGKTWRRAPMVPRGKHSWIAVLKPGDAEFVSFRTNARDSKANEVSQTAIRAMRLK